MIRTRSPIEMRAMLGVVLDAFGVPAAVMRTSAPGRLEFVAANSALEAILGCDPGALAGRRTWRNWRRGSKGARSPRPWSISSDRRLPMR